MVGIIEAMLDMNMRRGQRGTRGVLRARAVDRLQIDDEVGQRGKGGAVDGGHFHCMAPELPPPMQQHVYSR